MAFEKMAGEKQLVPLGTNQACAGTPCEVAHLRTVLPVCPRTPHGVALPPIWPNPAPPQGVMWGSPGHSSGVGGIRFLCIPGAVFCLTPTHTKGTHRHQRGAAGHPCQGHLSLPSHRSLPCAGRARHGAEGSQPRELVQVENNSVFLEQSDTGCICQAGSQHKASMPVLAQGKRHHYFWQGCLL